MRRGNWLARVVQVILVCLVVFVALMASYVTWPRWQESLPGPYGLPQQIEVPGRSLDNTGDVIKRSRISYYSAGRVHRIGQLDDHPQWIVTFGKDPCPNGLYLQLGRDRFLSYNIEGSC